MDPGREAVLPVVGIAGGGEEVVLLPGVVDERPVPTGTKVPVVLAEA